MDFFQSQDAARRKTGLLVFYFAIAVVLMIVGVYLIACAVESSMNHSMDESGVQSGMDFWQPDLLLIVAGIMGAIIGLGSLYKINELRGGGESVAMMLGGRRIHSNSTDPGERRLLNVVEEMALASGTPVPPVYVLDQEEGINAFAAGYTPSDAVIGVNRGTINFLSRDELQGVVAHEFSHILNGDMRMNVRLIGLLNGILLVAIIGYYMIRTAAYSGRSRNKKNDPGAALLVIGIAAVVLGFIGLFFARLIKASVSRQREYLADASAVQFTRNPDGIGGALKKIGGLSAGSKLVSAEAETASHMMFGNALGMAGIGPWATHPPLDDRIKKIDPSFDGQFPVTRPYVDPADTQKQAPQPQAQKQAARFPFPTPMTGEHAIPIEPVVILAGLGEPTTQHVQYSHDLIASMPDRLTGAIHDVFSARAVVFALLLDDDDEIRAKQLQIVQQNEGEPTGQETAALGPIVKEQGRVARLPIVEMVQSTLTEMSVEQYQQFHATVDALVKADKKIDLFEFMLQRVLISHLDRFFKRASAPPVRCHALTAVAAETTALISCLAHIGHDNDEETTHAFDLASAELASDGIKPQLMPKSECSLKVIDAALVKLAQASPSVKKRLLSAAMTCVGADGKVTVGESELLRAIADSLDCPIPPIAVGAIESV